MPSKNGNGVWKWVCGILVAVLLTGAASWQTFGGGISRSEASRMIQLESPYTKDKGTIDIRLKHIEEMVTEIHSDWHQ